MQSDVEETCGVLTVLAPRFRFAYAEMLERLGDSPIQNIAVIGHSPRDTVKAQAYTSIRRHYFSQTISQLCNSELCSC